MSKLNINALLADPEFQQQIQTQIRREAAEHNSYITYRDEQGRHVVEYPGSGQLYEQTEDRQLVLLSIGGAGGSISGPYFVGGG